MDLSKQAHSAPNTTAPVHSYTRFPERRRSTERGRFTSNDGYVITIASLGRERQQLQQQQQQQQQHEHTEQQYPHYHHHLQQQQQRQQQQQLQKHRESDEDREESGPPTPSSSHVSHRTSEAQEPLLAPPEDSSDKEGSTRQLDRRYRVASNLSWVVNILLLGAKAFAFYVSNSKAVLASLADSAVDLASQAVIAWADYKKRIADPQYPVGRSRLEALGVLACACIMSVSAFEVILTAGTDLYSGIFKDIIPVLDLGLIMYIILGVATGLKVICYLYCAALRHKSDSMEALAEDHLNDVLSNLAAIATAGTASIWQSMWWFDPTGAILISIYIVWRWVVIAQTQVDKVVGRAAPKEFVEQLERLANNHNKDMFVDVIRAYYFGARYIVELEVVMPPDTPLNVSHDTSLALQHQIECLEDVERAFVHVDYQQRTEPEHKVERLLLGSQSV